MRTAKPGAPLDVQAEVDQINARLAMRNNPIRVYLRGKASLALRGMLPREDGRGNKQGYVSPGLAASLEGLAEIEVLANELHRQIVKGEFDREQWKRSPNTGDLTAIEAIERFKQYHLKKSKTKESTWKEQWLRTFKPLLLQPNKPISPALLLAIVKAKTENTEARKRACQRCQSLADYLGIEIDLMQYAGDYGRNSMKPRSIPSDELIAEWRDRIPNEAWQWFYGMLAAFGLRPHEVFACAFINPRKVRVFGEIEDVGETKTGERVVRALMPEWSEKWDLMDMKLPKVRGQKPGDYGDRANKQFKRYKVPFKPYDLRHAYAIRGSVTLSIPDGSMASNMGHSEAVHRDTYHRWMTEATNDEIYDRYVVSRSTRPT